MPETKPEERSRAAARSTLTVLHVDGDREFLAAVAEHLESLDEHLDVTTEPNPAAALDRLERGGVDCLLTEATPPGTEPLQLVAHVTQEVPELPVVVVDNGLEGEAAAEAIAAGATEVMEKTTDPGALRVLANRLRNVTTGSAARVPSDGLVDAAPVGVWTLRGEMVVYANRACAELFGKDREELVGSSVHDLIAKADHATTDAHLESLLAGERTRRTDVVTGFGKWNERRRLELRSRRTEGDEGPAVLGAVVDVTEARRTARRFRTLYGELDQPVAEVTIENGRAVIQDVNASFEDVFGVNERAVVDDHLDDHLIPDEDAFERALEVYVRLERGTAVVEEVTRSTADGERAFQLQGLPFDVAGKPRAFLVYGDVTDSTRRERDLTALQAVARELMEADDYQEMAHIGAGAAERVLDTEVACVFGVDETGEALIPLAATEAARSLFGEIPAIPAGEGAAWYVHEMGDPLVTDDVREMDTIVNRETDVRSEMLLPIDGHGVFVASSTEVGVFDEKDEALGRTLASTLEAAFNRAEKDQLLRERERELVRENERLEEFAGIVSHDLRSPLAVVKGNASLLRDEGDIEYLNRIDAAADRMESLIEDLLSLARQGSMVEEPEFVDLADVVNRAWTTADTKDADLVADVDVSLRADPSRLRQLLENLFNNAVDHGGDDVTVRVETISRDEQERPGGQYGRGVDGFFVEDDGEGLPEDVDDLFEPGTTTDDDGTGFGLAIVNRIAEAHGWEVTATEGRTGGARFEFTGAEGT